MNYFLTGSIFSFIYAIAFFLEPYGVKYQILAVWSNIIGALIIAAAFDDRYCKNISGQ